MGENTSTTPDFTEQAHRRVTGEDLNGPRIKSEEFHPIGCDAVGLKRSNSTPFSTMNSSNTKTGHRPVTND